MGKKNLLASKVKSEIFSSFRVEEKSALFIHQFAKKYYFDNSVEGLRQIVFFAMENKDQLIEFTENKMKRKFDEETLI